MTEMTETGNYFSNDAVAAALPPEFGFYGRAREKRICEDVYARIMNGAREMMLVSGYTGIGKSSLIMHQRERVLASGGRFAYGKFDPGGRNIPYGAVIGAFQGLIDELLKGDAAQRERWRRRFVEALTPNGRVILRVLPALEALIGRQQELAALGPLENRNRFHLSFQKFVDLFLEEDRPFVICIDDLQWADLASLSLLRSLFAGAGGGSFLLVGAYRDNEVDERHPLTLTLRELEREGASITRIALGPLDLSAVRCLIQDAFPSSPDSSEAAARVVHEKTGGNPFYIGQFIGAGLREGRIRYTPPDRPAGPGQTPGFWEWNVDGLRGRHVTDNIADMLKMNVARFAPAGREMLSLAACLGSEFDLDTIAAVADRPRQRAFQDLGPFIQERLLFYINGRYYFAHDKIQEAVYSLIPEKEKWETHCGIGRRLWRKAGMDEVPNDVFLIADQLNAGREASVREVGEARLIELNLQAGRLAKESCAYRSALTYSETAVSLLGPDAWRGRYPTCLAAYRQAAEAALLSAEFESMQRFIRRALAESADFLDAVPFYEILIQSHIARNELQTAVATGKTVLRKLGIRLPRRPTVPRMLWLFAGTKLALRDRGIEDLLRLPPMSDPSMLAGIRIMVNMGTASYYSYPMLLPVLILTIMRTMLRFGNPPTAAFNYIAYGFLVCNIFGDVSGGYPIAQRAVTLIEKNGGRDLVAKSSLLYNVFIRPLGEHVRNSLPALLAGYEAGLETGDFDYASLCVTMYHSYANYTGLNLSRLDEEVRGHIETVRRIRQLRNLNTIIKDRMFRLALMGRLNDWRTWDFQEITEQSYLADFNRTNDKINLSSFYLDKAVVAYLLGEYDDSLSLSRLVKKYLDPGLGNFVVPEFCFNHALTLTALYHTKPPWVRWAFSFTVRNHLRRFRKLASRSPHNFENKYLLMQAEWARVRGRAARAEVFYDDAIDASRRNEFTNEEAMALELKARHMLTRRDEAEALEYLVAAHRCYTQWGALAKTAQLEAAYPRLKDILAERKKRPGPES